MTTRAIGNARLLRLANILDTADQAHAEKGEPTYYQPKFAHECGTPACALGHWAFNNRKRWTWKNTDSGVICRRKNSPGTGLFESAEFDLNVYQANELFGNSGCGEAKHAQDAATYIREFVKNRST